MTASIDEARVREILDGLKGVTPGPWMVASDLPAYAIMALKPDGTGGHRLVQTPNQNNYRHFGPSNSWDGISSHSNAAHIARLDPDTVRALCTLALSAIASRQAVVSEEAVADAINRARYVPGGLPERGLAEEDKGSQAYAYRLARAAISALAAPVRDETEIRANTVYLAARYSRAAELRGYRDQLEAMGYSVTSRWIEGGHELTKEGSTQAHETERQRFAIEDESDCMSAAIVISFTEEPRKTTTRGGRHVEFGMARASGKRLMVVGHRENVFHCLPGVEYFPDFATAIRALSQTSKPEGETR